MNSAKFVWWHNLEAKFIIIINLINQYADGFLPGGSDSPINTTQIIHATKITHHAQAKHNTQV
jgi:hypothetical protein